MTEDIPEITNTNISVCVKNNSGTALKDATVVLSKGNLEYTGTTGSAGGCTLRNVLLGDYDLTCTCENYNDFEDTLEVTADTTTLNITLSLKYTASTPDPFEEEEGGF